MKLTQRDKKELTKTKALAERIAGEIQRPQMRTQKTRYPKQRGLELDQIEQSYNQLDGEWLDWLGVSRKYEGKVPAQDRYDVRHDILIELARARVRDSEPIPLLRAYRIASLTVALYWRERIKREVKVCVYNGIPTEPHCANCRHKPKGEICPYQAIRPIQSLDQPTTDYELTLMDTVADDNAIEAIDIEAKVDASRYRLGCPIRLIEIAKRLNKGIPLDNKDKCYLQRFRRKEQKSLF